MTTLNMKTVTISYVFRAIKDQSKLDDLVAESVKKGYNHVSYETVDAEDETSETMYRRKQ